MRCFLLCCALLTATSVHADPVSSFNDISYWVGSGTNKAAIVIDWDGGSTADQSYVWGFRWDGAANGQDALLAIVNEDPRLFAKIGPDGSFGIPVFGIGYDKNNDGLFSLDDSTSFDSQGIAAIGPSGSDGSVSVDPADLYAEGWFSAGFWSIGTSNGNPFNGGSWIDPMSGAKDVSLSDGDWNSWAFLPGFFSTNPFAANPVAAVPELGSIYLLSLSALIALGWWRRESRLAQREF